jgi:hypothetical protein
VSGSLAAVDVQDLASDERGPFEIEDPVNDVLNVADSAEWVQFRQSLIGTGVKPGIPDDARADGIDPNAM